MNNNLSTTLPLAAMDQIPEPNSDAVTITGLVKKR